MKENNIMKFNIPYIYELTDTMKSHNKNKHQVDDSISGDYEPYFGWCDVKGCEDEGCSGGNAWRETGHWIVCSRHSDDYRKDKPQLRMKLKAIDRENSRDKTTGYLPIVNGKGI